MHPTWSPPPHSLHHRRELLARGVHPRRLASSEWQRVLPGWYTVAAQPASLESVCRLLQTEVLPGAVISHTTAAQLLRIPIPIDARRSGTIHYRVSLGGRSTLPTPWRAHRLPPGPTIRRFGITLSAPLELLLELATLLDHQALVAATDALVGPQETAVHASLSQLRTDACAVRHRTGIPAVRRALDDARELVESPQETTTRLLLVGCGFPEPEINVPIVDAVTGRRFRLDLAYPELRIAIEYDGDQHRLDRHQWQADRCKDDILHALGWRVLRVTAADLRAPDAFFARLRDALRARQPVLAAR